MNKLKIEEKLKNIAKNIKEIESQSDE